MRTSLALIGLTLAAASFGCESPGLEDQSGGAIPENTAAIVNEHQLPPGSRVMVNPNRRLVGSPAGEGRVGAISISDGSGTVTAKIWMCANHSPVSHPVIQCAVDPEYVLVGGGAWAAASGAGGLLTASYPADPQNLTTWEGRSKDHLVGNPHLLFVFAVGLHLSGVNRPTLRSNIVVSQSTGGPANHPEATLPNQSDGFLDLSGGAIDNWGGAGNMLTLSFPWVARGKDHEVADPATITLYRIGISKVIAGFGELEQLYKLTNNAGSTGVVEAEATLDSGFVPVGFSGFSAFNGAGRMLTRMGPADVNTVTRFIAASKDHVVADGGTTFMLLSQLRRKP
jgi:hypothetical protein